MARAIVPNFAIKTVQNPDVFVRIFQIVFDKMVAISTNFKWLGFRISDPIQNSNHMQPNLFSAIQNPN